MIIFLIFFYSTDKVPDWTTYAILKISGSLLLYNSLMWFKRINFSLSIKTFTQQFLDLQQFKEKSISSEKCIICKIMTHKQNKKIEQIGIKLPIFEVLAYTDPLKLWRRPILFLKNNWQNLFWCTKNNFFVSTNYI